MFGDAPHYQLVFSIFFFVFNMKIKRVTIRGGAYVIAQPGQNTTNNRNSNSHKHTINMFSGETNNKSVKFKKEQDFILQYKPSLNLINSYVSKKRITCTCGREISYSSLKSHIKTKYHKMEVNNIIAKFVSKMVDTVVDNMDMNVIDNVD